MNYEQYLQMLTKAKSIYDKIDSAESVSLNPQPVPEKISKKVSVTPSDNDLRFRQFRERNNALKSGFKYYEKSKELPEGIETGQTFSIQEETPDTQINIASNISTDYFEELRIKFQELISNPQVVAEIIDFLDKSNPDYIKELANNWTKYSSQIINLPRPINVERIKDFLTAKLDEELNKQGKLNNKQVDVSVPVAERNNTLKFFFGNDRTGTAIDSADVIRALFKGYFNKKTIGSIKDFINFEMKSTDKNKVDDIMNEFQILYDGFTPQNYKNLSNRAKTILDTNYPNAKIALPYLKKDIYNEFIQNNTTIDKTFINFYPQQEINFNYSSDFCVLESHIVINTRIISDIQALYNNIDTIVKSFSINTKDMKDKISKLTTINDLQNYYTDLENILNNVLLTMSKETDNLITLMSKGQYEKDKLSSIIRKGLNLITKEITALTKSISSSSASAIPAVSSSTASAIPPVISTSPITTPPIVSTSPTITPVKGSVPTTPSSSPEDKLFSELKTRINNLKITNLKEVDAHNGTNIFDKANSKNYMKTVNGLTKEQILQLIANIKKTIDDGKINKLSTSYIDYFEDNNGVSITDILNELRKISPYDNDLKTVYGLGLGKNKKQNPNHHIINNKYYVDKSLLDNGLYELRYIKNKHLKNKPITMTNKQLADMVKKIIYSKEYTNNDIESLPKEQQYIVYKIMKDMDLDIPSNANFNNEFNMLLAQIQNGNINEVIKQKFKRALSMAYDFGKITRHQMEKIKMDLNL